LEWWRLFLIGFGVEFQYGGLRRSKLKIDIKDIVFIRNYQFISIIHHIIIPLDCFFNIMAISNITIILIDLILSIRGSKLSIQISISQDQLFIIIIHYFDLIWFPFNSWLRIFEQLLFDGNQLVIEVGFNFDIGFPEIKELHSFL